MIVVVGNTHSFGEDSFERRDDDSPVHIDLVLGSNPRILIVGLD